MSAEQRTMLSDNEQYFLALHLLDKGLFGVNEDPGEAITLKSGRLSPHYLDMRKGISGFHTRLKVAKNMLIVVNRKSDAPIHNAYHHVVGTPEAMTSYAATIADLARMSLLQPRVATDKTSGNKVPILGVYSPGDIVAAFDDVVTEGQSKIDAIGALADAELVVGDYYVVVDREEGGAPHVTEVTGVEVTPALGISSMVRLLHADGRLNQAQFDNVARYIDQYGEPHAKDTMESTS
jgi:orotate phosphoribosyltransferase